MLRDHMLWKSFPSIYNKILNKNVVLTLSWRWDVDVFFPNSNFHNSRLMSFLVSSFFCWSCFSTAKELESGESIGMSAVCKTSLGNGIKWRSRGLGAQENHLCPNLVWIRLAKWCHVVICPWSFRNAFFSASLRECLFALVYINWLLYFY